MLIVEECGTLSGLIFFSVKRDPYEAGVCRFMCSAQRPWYSVVHLKAPMGLSADTASPNGRIEPLAQWV